MRTLFFIIVSLLGFSAYAQQPKAFTNSIGMKLVLILPGNFVMGSPIEQEKWLKIETRHLVTISNWYYLGAYEVTQNEYEKLMGENPSGFKGAKNPVETVSWDDAVAFCQKLSELPEEQKAGRTYRLPTEAEWEYGARATSTNLYCFGDSADLLKDYAWFGDPAGSTHPVGQKKSNPWGLHDMHGNVMEWCQDWYADYTSGDTTDPQGPENGSSRVYRGGGYAHHAEFCRIETRGGKRPAVGVFPDRGKILGFRVAMSVPTKQPVAISAK